MHPRTPPLALTWGRDLAVAFERLLIAGVEALGRTAGGFIDIQIDRLQALQAVINAAMQVQTGAADLVIAGGAESMGSKWIQWSWLDCASLAGLLA